MVCGDSLLGPDPSTGTEVQGTLGRDVEKIQRLGQLKASYMRAYSGSEKGQLKSEIEELTSEIRQELGFTGASPGVIDWQVEFAEVFGENLGFDIAIANPPYIQLQNNGGRLANLYKDAGYQTFARTGDIYQLFYERGCQILKSSQRAAGLHHVQQLAEGRIRQGHPRLFRCRPHAAAASGTGQGCF